MANGQIRYGYLDQHLVVFDDAQAFQFFAGAWHPLHLADATCNARLLTKPDFERFAAAGGEVDLPLPLR